MSSVFGGKVTGCTHREYGYASVEVVKLGAGRELADRLFDGFEQNFQVRATYFTVSRLELKGILQVWMSHGDQVTGLPADFDVVGKTTTAPFAAVAHKTKPFFGIQFHPEVTHTPKGKEVIGKFVLNICECRAEWTMVSTCVWSGAFSSSSCRNPSSTKKSVAFES